MNTVFVQSQAWLILVIFQRHSHCYAEDAPIMATHARQNSVQPIVCWSVCLPVCMCAALAACACIAVVLHLLMNLLPKLMSVLAAIQLGAVKQARGSCCFVWHDLNFQAMVQIFLLDMEGGSRGHASGQRWHEDLQWAHRLDEGWNLAAVKQVTRPTCHLCNSHNLLSSCNELQSSLAHMC